MCGTIRVLLADRQSLIRVGIRTTLNIEEDLMLVGETTSIYEAQQLSLELKPDVLLLDLYMLDSTLPETVACFHDHCPQMKVLILAISNNICVSKLVAVGARGCVIKDEEAETLICAIRTVAQGRTWFSRHIVEKLVQLEKGNPLQTKESTLTNREQQILNMVAQGWDNTRIAAELYLAEQTVRNYVSCIYQKLSVSSRAEAIVRTWENSGVGLQKQRD